MKIKALRCLTALAGATMLVVSSPASGTTLAKMNLDEVVEQSDAIVLGEAIGSQTVRKDGAVYTMTEFRVSETLDGSAGSVVTVAVPGGSYETPAGVRVGEVVAGAPRLIPGTQALLFLENDVATGEMCVVGFSQGVMTVSDSNGSVSLSGLGKSNVSLSTLRSEISTANAASADIK